MATYLKRTSKLFDLTLSRNSADVSLRDLMCPVCRGILIEPVSLPCTHNLCLRCLKGTFAHNSLSCPLCRVRVGSWLRTATKSETLVNNELWQLIRTRFPKEVENKYSGDDEDVTVDDTDYSVPNRILSTAGEIRREYEAQLQLAQKELLRQREAERIASEALIRKIQAEEQQQKLVQLAEDKLLAKSLAKKQFVEKSKEALKYTTYDQYMKPQNASSSMNSVYKDDPRICKDKRENNVGQKSNVECCSTSTNSTSYAFTKPRDHYAISRTLNVNKDACTSVAINMTTTKTKKYSPEPGCSNSLKIYGLQSKEELHVPNDVINSKKKTLDVEVCVTKVTNDEGRIGSAESGGSRDSINQEIHHFKPIKAMPRTPLLINAEGKQVDPKLIRVVPIVKKVSNILPKPPSPTHSKRVFGCSWSAFKRQWKLKPTASEVSPKKVENEKASSIQPPNNVKSKVYEDCRLSIDTNKNYTKNMNKVMNGARKVSKKMSPEYPAEEKPSKSVSSKSKQKYKRQKPTTTNETVQEAPSGEVVENIAERIKRRKSVAESSQKRGNKSNVKYEDKDDSLSSEKCDSDDEIVKQQQRIEQLVLQEKQDFELAMRLQAQFDELERKSTRTTRGSKRAIECNVAQSTDSDDEKSSPQRKRRCRQTRRAVA